LRKKALSWHQCRAEEFREKEEEDDWPRYEHALKHQFTNDLEADEFIGKMEDLMYKGDIRNYVTEMNLLNRHVGVLGAVWKRMIKMGLSDELLDRFSFIEVKNAPQHDDDWIERLKTCGICLERSKKERKLLRPHAMESEKGKSKIAGKPEQPSAKDPAAKPKKSPQRQKQQKRTHSLMQKPLRQRMRLAKVSPRNSEQSDWKINVANAVRRLDTPGLTVEPSQG